MERNKFFWNVAVLFSLIVIAWSGWTLRGKQQQIERFEEKTQQSTVGTTDKDLDREIALLETHLQERTDFQFLPNNNPLNLTNVVFLTDDMGRYLTMMNREDIRVSMILYGQSPRVVLYFQGEKYEMSAGQSVKGIKILKIKPDQATIAYKGEQKTYSVAGFSM